MIQALMHMRVTVGEPFRGVRPQPCTHGTLLSLESRYVHVDFVLPIILPLFTFLAQNCIVMVHAAFSPANAIAHKFQR